MYWGGPSFLESMYWEIRERAAWMLPKNVIFCFLWSYYSQVTCLPPHQTGDMHSCPSKPTKCLIPFPHSQERVSELFMFCLQHLYWSCLIPFKSHSMGTTHPQALCQPRACLTYFPNLLPSTSNPRAQAEHVLSEQLLKERTN